MGGYLALGRSDQGALKGNKPIKGTNQAQTQIFSDFCRLSLFSLKTNLSAPKSQRFLQFAIAMPIADPRNRAISEARESNVALRLRVRWKVASDLRFRAAISEPKTPSFCRISGDLALSTRKSLAIAIVRFWCAKKQTLDNPDLDGLIRANRFADSRESPDSRESFQGS